MAKKSKPLKLNKIRAYLLKNCDNWLSRFESISVYLSVGAAATTELQKKTSQSTAGSQQWYVQPMSTHESDVIILIQTALVQEWNIFIDSVFYATILHFLEMGDVDKLPTERVDLKKIVSSDICSLRKSIATAARESFSFKPYDNKIEILRKIYKVNDGPIESVLKKHVEIRNIFQHNRGLVRQTDLIKTGGAGFDILQEDQTKKIYKVGDTIILTLCEVKHFNKTIKDYSNNFEVLQ